MKTYSIYVVFAVLTMTPIGIVAQEAADENTVLNYWLSAGLDVGGDLGVFQALLLVNASVVFEQPCRRIGETGALVQDGPRLPVIQSLETTLLSKQISL